MEPIEIKEVCRYFDTTYSDARKVSKVRKKEILLVRYYSFLFLKERLPKLSLEQIGRYFDQDHATVLNGLKKIGYWIETDYEKRYIYDAIKFRLDLLDKKENHRSQFFVNRIKIRRLKNPTLKKNSKKACILKNNTIFT